MTSITALSRSHTHNGLSKT